jgi:hypothetical protein
MKNEFLENRFFNHRGCVRIPKNLKSSNEDDDVAAERERIYSDRDNTNNDILRMVDLVKVTNNQEEKKEKYLKMFRFMDRYLEKLFPRLNKHV